MSAIIGALRANLSLNSAAFESGRKRAEASMGKLERSLQRASRNMQKHGRRMSLAITAPLALAVRSSLKVIDAQAKMAKSLGTSVRSMQVLSRAADLSGVSMGEVEQATIQLTKRLSEVAQTGKGPTADALKLLRLRAEDLQKLPLDERLVAIQDAMAKYVPEAQRAAVATDLFGVRAGVVFTRIDSAALRLATEDVKRFGVAVTEVQAGQIERTNDALSRLGLVGRGLANQFTAAIAPAMEALSDRAARLAEWFNGLSDRTKSVIASGVALVGALGPAAVALGLVLKVAVPLGASMLGLGATVALLPVRLIAVTRQVIALELALGASGRAAAVASITIKGMSRALRVLRAAAWAALGPWGVLAGVVAGAASYLLVFKKNTGKLEEPMKRAKEAQEKLNTQVAAFAAAYAPEAGAAAINTANDYYALSKAAYDVAAAELAKRKAYADGAAANFAPGPVQRAAAGEAATAARALAKAQAELSKAERARTTTALRVIRADREMAETQRDLNGTIDVAVETAGSFGGKLDKVADAAANAADAIQGPLSSAVDGVSQAFGDWVSSGLSDFKSMWDGIRSAAKRGVSDLAATFAKNKLNLFLGISGTGAAGAAGQAVGGAGGQGGGLLGGLLGNVLGGGSFFGSVGSGVQAALGLGGFSSAGLFGFSSNAATAVATGASQLGASIGAVLPALGVIAAGIGILAKGLIQKYADTAIRGTLGSEGFDGTSFDWYRGGFLRGDKASYKPVADEVQGLLDSTMKGVTTSLKGMALSLGLTTGALAGFSDAEFTLWTNGKDAAQIQAELGEQIEGTSDKMAALVLGTERFTRIGESATEALTRLSTSIETVNGIMDTLEDRLFKVSLRGADTASALADAFGGLEAMQSAATAYWTGFYSEQERFDTQLRQLRARFKDLGLVMPESREGFRALVESIDLGGAAGRELYAALVSLSGAMNEVLPQVESLTLSMTGLMDRIGGEIGAQLDASQALSSDAKEAAQLWYKTADTLRGFIRDLVGTNLSAASRQQTLAVQRARFATASAMARSGDVQAAQDVPALAKALLEAERGASRSDLEYRKLAARVAGEVEFAAGIAELEGANKDVLRGLYEKQIEVLSSLGQFLQLEGLTDDQVAKLDGSVKRLVKDWDGTVGQFKASLKGLERAITEAKAFSYDDLVARLDTTIALSSSSPDWLKRLVEKAGSDIRTTLDFVIRRNDLTPDMRWIAVNSLSEHVKSLRFTVTRDIGDRAKRLALSAGGELRRALRFTVTRDLPDDLKRIALAGNSELSRVVNVSLNRLKSDRQALRLALGNIRDYAINVTASFDKGVPRRLRNVVLKNSGTYAAMIEAAITELGGDERRILLRQQGRYTAIIGATLKSDLPKWKRLLLAQSATVASRAITIGSAFGDVLTKQQKKLLREDATTAIRTITAGLKTGSFSGADWRFLRQLEETDSPVRKILGKVDLSGLTDRQKGLVDAITGATKGTITLGGTFRFAPTEAFSTLFEDATDGVNGLSAPLGRLTGMLDKLRAAVAKNTEAQAAERKIAELQSKGAAAAERLDTRKSSAAALVSSIRDLEARTGVDIRNGAGDALLKVRKDGTIAYDATHVAYGAGADLEAFKKAFWADGGLEDQIAGRNSAIARALDTLTSLRQKLRGLNAIPGFASGGGNPGGWRVVGERGWELEHTGPSRVISNSESRRMLDNSAVVAEQRAVLGEVARLNTQVGRMAKEIEDQTIYQRSSDRTLRKLDLEGIAARG